MDVLLWGRVVERALAVAIGGLSIALGYRLFVRIPRLRPGDAKLALPGDISVYLTRVGPGTFFALFGAAIVVSALRVGLDLEGPAAPGAPASAAAAALRVHYANPPLARDDADERQARRAEARRSAAELNGIPSLLRADTAPARRLDVELALRDAKLTLMQSVWGRDWGDFERFAVWARTGAPDVVPPDVHPQAATLWRAPRP